MPKADDASLLRALEVVCLTGSFGRPVPAESARLEAAFALRRWRSFARRHPTASKHVPERDARIEDLARGLAIHHEGSLAMAGPTLTDHRWQAERIAAVLAPTA